MENYFNLYFNFQIFLEISVFVLYFTYFLSPGLYCHTNLILGCFILVVIKLYFFKLTSIIIIIKLKNPIVKNGKALDFHGIFHFLSYI